MNIVEKHFASSPVAQIPPGGYTKEDKNSKISVVWLQWIMEQRRKEGDHSFQLTHALNGVEKRIPHISTSGKKKLLPL